MRERTHLMRGIRAGAPVTERRRPPGRSRLLCCYGATVAALAAAGLIAGATPAAADCPDAPIVPEYGATYPEGCYVYEMVSPPDKGAGEVQGGAKLGGFRAGEAGDRIIFPMNNSYGGAGYFFIQNSFFAARTVAGWGTTPAILPFQLATNYTQPGHVVPEPLGMSPDGRQTIVATNVDPETGAPLAAPSLYKVDLDTQSAMRVSEAPVGGLWSAPVGEVAGARDWSSVYFGTTSQLTSDATPPALVASSRKLYRFDEEGGLELASRTQDGLPGPGFLVSDVTQPSDPPSLNGSVSADGSVLFFSPQTGSQARVLRREAGEPFATLVNASENDDLAIASGPAQFQGASDDGNSVVVRSIQPLVTGMAATPGANLFLYEHSNDPVNDQNLTLLTDDQEPSDGATAGAYRVLGMSKDGSIVYFTTSGQIVAGGETGAFGKLYRWEDGQVEYISRVGDSASDRAAGGTSVSDDGRYAVFLNSGQGLTAEDNGGFLQVYVYDAVAGNLRCASCRVEGANAAHASFGRTPNTAAVTLLPRRNLTDGGRVFFEATDPLLPRDTNGKTDVYMWHDGELSLISSGRHPDGARFADASRDGHTVFLRTRARLSGWDTDDRADLYAARVNGGLPEPVPPNTAPCAGEECQGPAGGAPQLPPAVSVDLMGEGNVRPMVPLRVTGKRMGGAAAVLMIRVPGSGRLSVGGPRVRGAQKRVGSAGRERIRVRLSRAARRIRARRGQVRVRVAVRFTTADGRSRTVRVPLTFRSMRNAKSGRRVVQRRVAGTKGGR